MSSVLDIAALLLGMAALSGWLNLRFIHLPQALLLLLTGLAVAAAIVMAERVGGSGVVVGDVERALHSIDFSGVVLQGMLALLLFASALSVDLGRLKRRSLMIATLALVGTTVATAATGLAFWLSALALAAPLSAAWCFVFGALISPTDPVAVMGVTRSVEVSEGLLAELEGEALFNDGMGVVLFSALVAFATEPAAGLTFSEFAILLLREIGGGLGLGLAAGYASYRAISGINNFTVESMITLALAVGVYAVAQHLHVSGPLAVVAAGLFIGEQGLKHAMSGTTRRYLTAFWTLIDRILNALLFLLIGLEVLVLRYADVHLGLALAAIPIVIAARLLALLVPLAAKPLMRSLSPRNIPFLTWGGVRGGVSIALALSIPEGPEKEMILAATYAVVLFGILLQLPTLPRVARWTIASSGKRLEQD
ncbi:MAG: sodium:proton antiporter [Hyphomicrobiales bacterium]